MRDSLIFYCLKTIEFSFYALFFLVPLVLSNNTSELFELNKMWLTWGITIVVSAAWISKMIAEKQVRIVRTPLDIPLFLFLLSQLVSTIFSLDFHVSLWGYYSRFNGGFLSLLSYVLLFYAFVSNYYEIKKLPVKEAFSLSARLGMLLLGGILIALSLPLSAPPTQASDGQAYIFYATLVTALGIAVMAFRASFFNKLLFIMLYSGVIVTLWGIPSHFGSDPTCYLFRGTLSVDCWTESFKPTIRAFSTLGQPAWLAAYLSFLIPISMGFALNRIGKYNESLSHLRNFRFVIFFSISCLFYIGLLFANTRAGFLGFWIGNAFFWIMLFFLLGKMWNKLLKIGAFMNLSFVFLTFVFGIPITQLQEYTLPYFTQSEAHAQTPQENNENQSQESSETTSQNQVTITESGNIRLNVWEGALRAWHANPIFGTGVETFAFAYYTYKPEAQNLTSEWDFLYNKAHNEYLNYLATTGIFGLGTYILLIAWFLVPYIVRFLTKWFYIDVSDENYATVKQYTLTLAFVAGYITILVTNFFGFSVVIINLFFFLTPAFVFILQSSITSSHTLSFPKNTGQADTGSLTGFQLAGIFGIVLIACFTNLVLLRYWNADKAYALGSNLDRIGEYGTAWPLLEDAVKLRPGEPTFRDELAFNNAAIASSYMLSNDATQAATFLSNAQLLSNSVIEKHPNNIVFWKNRVRMYYLLSQVDPQFLPFALESIEKAVQLAPNDAKILYNYGVILGQTDRVDEGIHVLEKTISLKPDFRDAHFALALFYHDKATDKNERVIHSELQQKAESLLEYILTHINAEDNDTKETLESWRSQ